MLASGWWAKVGLVVLLFSFCSTVLWPQTLNRPAEVTLYTACDARDNKNTTCTRLHSQAGFHP